MPPAVKAWSLNHWTAREVPVLLQLNLFAYVYISYSSLFPFFSIFKFLCLFLIHILFLFLLLSRRRTNINTTDTMHCHTSKATTEIKSQPWK